ncbi:leucine-rich repeat extensin-like protein 4 [Helianthus annuus]|uniref:leucine-rich repeat extensin-like protein 4 n=1 Tax=Helianthus annuus TaxID=4232 RepID=UPI000B8F0026|nr:leucine-rich repeat extensin-like protein 4 [Helianthus annuus]
MVNRLEVRLHHIQTPELSLSLAKPSTTHHHTSTISTTVATALHHHHHHYTITTTTPTTAAPPQHPPLSHIHTIILTLLISAYLTFVTDNSGDVNTLLFENPRLWKAYVCSYGRVYCAPFPTNPSIRVVARIDLNHSDIAGYLPSEIGLLTDLALFDINSNRFCGTVPTSFKNLTLLYELDISNNRFVGIFPTVVLSLPALRYLDLRFNGFGK